MNRLLIILQLALLSVNSFAQNSIFAGKVTGEDNKPVPGTRIMVSLHGSIADEVVADKDGLYYTRLLAAGNYSLDVIAYGKHLKASACLKAGDTKQYYNLEIGKDDLRVIVTAHDPFIQAQLGKIEVAQEKVDFGTQKIFIVKPDTARRTK
jgi:hypothetical protein